MRGNALVLMAKAPERGRVKTRLSGALGDDAAAELARALLIDQLTHLQPVETADLYLAFAPARARDAMERLAPARWTCFAQEGRGLGERMQAIFAKLFAAGHDAVVLIGGDLPALPLPALEEAYAFLQSKDRRVVLGPAADGGYYLVGCNRPTPEIFRKMRWSHGAVLAQTRARLSMLDIDHRLLPGWFDLDTAEDLAALRAVLESSVGAAMPHTANLLQRLSLKNG